VIKVDVCYGAAIRNVSEPLEADGGSTVQTAWGGVDQRTIGQWGRDSGRPYTAIHFAGRPVGVLRPACSAAVPEDPQRALTAERATSCPTVRT
jgi:hypothetical protein